MVHMRVIGSEFWLLRLLHKLYSACWEFLLSAFSNILVPLFGALKTGAC